MPNIRRMDADDYTMESASFIQKNKVMWFVGKMDETGENPIELIRPMTERQISGLERRFSG